MQVLKLLDLTLLVRSLCFRLRNIDHNHHVWTEPLHQTFVKCLVDAWTYTTWPDCIGEISVLHPQTHPPYPPCVDWAFILDICIKFSVDAGTYTTWPDCIGEFSMLPSQKHPSYPPCMDWAFRRDSARSVELCPAGRSYWRMQLIGSSGTDRLSASVRTALHYLTWLLVRSLCLSLRNIHHNYHVWTPDVFKALGRCQNQPSASKTSQNITWCTSP